MKHLTLILILAISFGACRKGRDQSEIDRDIIVKYINDHQIQANATASGLYYVIEKEGTGSNPSVASTVTVVYKGYLADGSVFDQSDAAGATFGLSQTIAGWQEGIPLFKKGGSGKLFVPSALGYGPGGNGKIPGNAVLIFDIQLLNIK